MEFIAQVVSLHSYYRKCHQNRRKSLGNEVDVGGVTVQKIEQYLHKCGEVWPIFWIVRPAPQQHAPSVSMQKHYIPPYLPTWLNYGSLINLLKLIFQRKNTDRPISMMLTAVMLCEHSNWIVNFHLCTCTELHPANLPQRQFRPDLPLLHRNKGGLWEFFTV